MLATSFGLTRPSSGQYLLKLKNTGAYNMTRRNHGIQFKIIIVLYTTDNTTIAGISYKEQ